MKTCKNPNCQMCKEGKMPNTFHGKLIEEMSKEEMIEAILHCATQIHDLQSDLLDAHLASGRTKHL